MFDVVVCATRCGRRPVGPPERHCQQHRQRQHPLLPGPLRSPSRTTCSGALPSGETRLDVAPSTLVRGRRRGSTATTSTSTAETRLAASRPSCATSWPCGPRRPVRPPAHRHRRGPDACSTRSASPAPACTSTRLDGRDLRQHRQRQHGAPTSEQAFQARYVVAQAVEDGGTGAGVAGRRHPARQRRRPARLLTRRTRWPTPGLRPPCRTSTSASR